MQIPLGTLYAGIWLNGLCVFLTAAFGFNLETTIIVTGAGQGIGQALGNLAIELGANVVGVDLNTDGLRVSEEKHGGRWSGSRMFRCMDIPFQIVPHLH